MFPLLYLLVLGSISAARKHPPEHPTIKFVPCGPLSFKLEVSSSHCICTNGTVCVGGKCSTIRRNPNIQATTDVRTDLPSGYNPEHCSDCECKDTSFTEIIIGEKIKVNNKPPNDKPLHATRKQAPAAGSVGSDSWSEWFQCAKEAWAGHWAINQVELCSNSSSDSVRRCTYKCMGLPPVQTTPGRTKEPWFCHGGGELAVNFTAIDFDRIRYTLPTTESKFKLPGGFLSPIGCAAPDPMLAPEILSGGNLPRAATLHFLLPGGIAWNPSAGERCTKVVRGRTVVLTIRAAVKNWFHGSFQLVEIMLMLLAADVFATGAPIDIVLLPPDKSNDGNHGNHLSILEAFADHGKVYPAIDLKKEVVCYESAVVALGRHAAFHAHTTPKAREFDQVVQGKCSNISSGGLTPTYMAFTGLIKRRLGINPKYYPRASPHVILVTRLKQQEKYNRSYPNLKRQILNQPAVVAALQASFNTTVVDLQDRTFRDQVVLIGSACALVGMHGAGLTNAMFMPAGSSVVEIAKEGSYGATAGLFESIAGQISVHHSMILVPKSDCTPNESCNVPISKLVSTVSASVARCTIAGSSPDRILLETQ